MSTRYGLNFLSTGFLRTLLFTIPTHAPRAPPAGPMLEEKMAAALQIKTLIRTIKLDLQAKLRIIFLEEDSSAFRQSALVFPLARCHSCILNSRQ
jgi:hypothetical protein